ncbi:dolichol kinase [Desulfobotulus alkaliphilus]|uniref:Dolichol kinase n=1 Tax=Desulfobotulus alkaliphilus TaxID=622671 RepID=A0A562RWZ8_9BACT|nr:hypothetical protein [Desulfobotulus alkaliphilus]TWI73034.1 dolichol kinase [Desulfobotulus alkaliphilus]
MPLTREEINRKLLHLMALLMPLGIFYLPRFFPLTALHVSLVLGSLFGGSLLVETLRFRHRKLNRLFSLCFGPLMRAGESRSITGSTYIIGGAFFCSLFFAERPDISFVVLFVFILSDAAAALVGISMGKTRILGKSLEGTMACFATAMVLMLLIFPFFPHVLDFWGGRLPLGAALMTALAITLLELIPIPLPGGSKTNDNLVAPVLSGFILYLF